MIVLRRTLKISYFDSDFLLVDDWVWGSNMHWVWNLLNHLVWSWHINCGAGFFLLILLFKIFCSASAIHLRLNGFIVFFSL